VSGVRLTSADAISTGAFQPGELGSGMAQVDDPGVVRRLRKLPTFRLPASRTSIALQGGVDRRNTDGPGDLKEPLNRCLAREARTVACRREPPVERRLFVLRKINGKRTDFNSVSG